MSNAPFLLLACDPLQSPLRAVAGGLRQAIVHGPYGHRPAMPERPGSGFTGQWREAGTGWYLLGNGYRVYNPVLMRFHSPDSLSPFERGGLNAYGYCLGDPINFVDEDGHAPFGFLVRLARFLGRSGLRRGKRGLDRVAAGTSTLSRSASNRVSVSSKGSSVSSLSTQDSLVSEPLRPGSSTAPEGLRNPGAGMAPQPKPVQTGRPGPVLEGEGQPLVRTDAPRARETHQHLPPVTLKVMAIRESHGLHTPSQQELLAKWKPKPYRAKSRPSSQSSQFHGGSSSML